MVLVITSGAK